MRRLNNCLRVKQNDVYLLIKRSLYFDSLSKMIYGFKQFYFLFQQSVWIILKKLRKFYTHVKFEVIEQYWIACDINNFIASICPSCTQVNHQIFYVGMKALIVLFVLGLIQRCLKIIESRY